MNGALFDVAPSARIGNVLALHVEPSGLAWATGATLIAGGQTSRPVAGAPPSARDLSDNP